MAAAGFTCSIRGLPGKFGPILKFYFRPAPRETSKSLRDDHAGNEEGNRNSSQTESPRDPQPCCSIDGGAPIVRHNSPSARQRLQLTNRKRLPNIEPAKKYKAQQQIFPVGGNC